MDLNNKKQRDKILLLILVLTFLLYGNTIKNKYALDDNYVTITNPDRPNNPKIEKGIRGIPKIFSSHYIDSKQQSFEYRPIVLATFAIEYQFFGCNPHINHFINLLLYALTNCILFMLLIRVLKGYNYLFPILIVLLFIIHPIHTEVVANIKSRDELLSFLFGMCSLLFAQKYIESKNIKFIIISMFFIFIGLLCKKTAILFIPIIPLTYYFFNPIKTKQLILFSLSTTITFASFSILKKILLTAESGARVFAFFENPLFYETNILNKISLALYSIGYYIKLLVIPHPLCCYYGYNTIPLAKFTSPFVIISFLFHISIFIYALIKIKEKNILAFGILFYLIGIFPFTNLLSVPTGIIAERYIYFATFGYCLCIAFFLLKFFKIDLKEQSKKIPPTFYLVLFIIFIFHSSITISRNAKWKDEMTLFKNDCKNFENSCNLQYITGNKLYLEMINTPSGAKKDALITEMTSHFKRALKLMEDGVKEYPKDYTTLNNIGTIYVNIFNDAKSAQPYFKKSLLLKPTDEVTQYNYAFCFEKKNLEDSAIIFYEKMITNQTNYLPVYSQLRALYLKKMDFDKTIECDKKAVNISQKDARLYINLGNSYISNKDTLNGIIQFEKAIELEPTNFPLKKQIIAFLDSAGFTERAKKIKNTSLNNDAP